MDTGVIISIGLAIVGGVGFFALKFPLLYTKFYDKSIGIIVILGLTNVALKFLYISSEIKDLRAFDDGGISVFEVKYNISKMIGLWDDLLLVLSCFVPLILFLYVLKKLPEIQKMESTSEKFAKYEKAMEHLIKLQEEEIEIEKKTKQE